MTQDTMKCKPLSILFLFCVSGVAVLGSANARADAATPSIHDPELTFAALHMLSYIHQQAIKEGKQAQIDQALEKDIAVSPVDFSILLSAARHSDRTLQTQPYLHANRLLHSQHASGLNAILKTRMSARGYGAWAKFVQGRFRETTRVTTFLAETGENR